MATLAELSAEYRRVAAQLAFRIKQKQEAGVPAQELAKLRAILTDIREVQRILDSYYELPRTSSLTMCDLKGRRTNGEKSE